MHRGGSVVQSRATRQEVPNEQRPNLDNFDTLHFEEFRRGMQLKLSYFIIGIAVVQMMVLVAGDLSHHPACHQPKASGLCRGKILRYAFDVLTGTCVSFFYSGCASTANNFLTYEECRRECMLKIRY